MTAQETREQVEILFREAAEMLRGIYPGAGAIDVMVLENGKMSINVFGHSASSSFAPNADYYFYPSKEAGHDSVN